jgi:hypothetical protein
MRVMLKPVCPADPAFPMLDAALDKGRAAFALAKALALEGYVTTDLKCTVERARVDAGHKALIGYRLHGHDQVGREIDQRAMLALFPGANPESLPDRSEGVALNAPEFGPATLKVDQLAGQAWLFPNDRKVHHIAHLSR